MQVPLRTGGAAKHVQLLLIHWNVMQGNRAHLFATEDQ